MPELNYTLLVLAWHGDPRGFDEEEVSVSYPADGVWHYSPDPWTGPRRQCCEKLEKFAERYNEAAKAFFGINPLVLVFTEWGNISNPHRSLQNAQ